MKVGRRGFLGLMAGGVAAGPKLATSLAAQASGASSIGFSYGEDAVTSDAEPDSGHWKSTRIAKIQSWLNGDRAEDEEEKLASRLRSLEDRERFRLDSLRSVSTSHRHAMFIEGEFARAERLKELRLKKQLARLTGGLL